VQEPEPASVRPRTAAPKPEPAEHVSVSVATGQRLAVAVLLADGPADVIAFALEGDNDASDAQQLRSTLDALPDTAVPLIIDLSSATFIDSSVAGILVEQARIAANGGRAFAVFLPEAASEYVRRLITTTQLDSILPLHHNWNDMLASLRQRHVINDSLLQSIPADRHR
jgi:anti-anti-sigma factor